MNSHIRIINHIAMVFIFVPIVASFAHAKRHDEQQQKNQEKARMSQVQHATKMQEIESRKNVNRLIYQELMLNAYQKYPNIPNGVLESLAFISTRWNHRLPKKTKNYNGMPLAIGLFGLYNTNDSGFVDVLSKVALSEELTTDKLKANVEVYVDATAHYISAQIDLRQTEMKLADDSVSKSAQFSLADMRLVLSKLSGIQIRNQVSQYSVNSFVYDLLTMANKGYRLGVIDIAPIPVDLAKVFSYKELKQLGASKLLLDSSKDQISDISTNTELRNDETNNVRKIEAIGFFNEYRFADIPARFNPEDFVVKKKDLFALLINGTAEYPGALWVEAANYSSRQGDQISHIVIHTMQGSYSGSINFFLNPSTQASAHYMMRSSDGQITQMVHDADKAWHARSANSYSIGIEHEGFVDDVSWYTVEMITESAKLANFKCEEFAIDCSNAYQGESHDTVVLLSEDFTLKGHQHYPDQTHTDPGINWDWPNYYSLVNGGVIPNQFPQAIFSYSCQELSCTFDANASLDSDGEITTYSWDFGNGSSGAGIMAQVNYSESGSYNVVLTVTDDTGAVSSDIQVIRAAKAIPPAKSKSGGGSLGILLWALFLFLCHRKASRLDGFRILYSK